jgi:hypothetical protein
MTFLNGHGTSTSKEPWLVSALVQPAGTGYLTLSFFFFNPFLYFLYSSLFSPMYLPGTIHLSVLSLPLPSSCFPFIPFVPLSPSFLPCSFSINFICLFHYYSIPHFFCLTFLYLYSIPFKVCSYRKKVKMMSHATCCVLTTFSMKSVSF